MTASFSQEDTLVVVDVQNDFCPGGALAVKEGDEIVPVLNEAIGAAVRAGVPVVVSRDWHPERHCSFEEQGGPWPRHCVQETTGAEFHPDLALPGSYHLVSKGEFESQDQYSAFDGTGLVDWLRHQGVKRVWVGGLAQDVCVRATVLDACRAGFDVKLMRAATRAVDPDSGRRSLDEMKSAGAELV